MDGGQFESSDCAVVGVNTADLILGQSSPIILHGGSVTDTLESVQEIGAHEIRL